MYLISSKLPRKPEKQCYSTHGPVAHSSDRLEGKFQDSKIFELCGGNIGPKKKRIIKNSGRDSPYKAPHNESP